jgi:hypothetical protein
MKQLRLLLAQASVAALLQACAGSPSQPASPPATPTPAGPARAVENPPDVRARMSLRPTPPQPESRFPPPQQSEEDEARNANRPGEPDLLHVEPAVFLDGESFPEKKTYDPAFPEPRRTRYVSSAASGPGDGSLEHPWKDLQEALCRLEPGDRLLLAADIYAGSFRIAGACRSGTADRPIQVFARHAFLKPAGAGDVLTVERAHWQFWEMQIALLDSASAGFVTTGPEAHDIALDQSHIYEGRGPAVRLAAGSSAVTLSNCHIHQSSGVEIDAGTRGVTLVNNHIHHNRTASVTVGKGSGEAAQDIRLLGNRLHNDRGPALDLSNCRGLTIARNKLSNYRPGDATAGEAIVVRSGCRDVSIEYNSVLEASVALRVGGDPSESGPAPRAIVLQRNYLENRLTPDSVGLRVERGEDVRFVNNVIDRYSEPILLAPAGVERVSIANNLVIEPRTAFTLGSPASVSLFDYNVFGSGPNLKAVVGADRVEAAAWMALRMPHSRVVSGADLIGGDLGKIAGFSPVDAGKALEGLPFLGAAPDVGVAEK